MKRFIFTILALLAVPLSVLSQYGPVTLSKKEQRKVIPSYVAVSSGVTISRFIDFATSPLDYTGGSVYVSLSRLKMNEKRESETGLSYSHGIAASLYNDNLTGSIIKNASLYYSKLYQSKKLSSEKYNVKIGGMLDVTGNFRNNPSFYNNAVGVDIIPTLFGSVKATRDVSRKKTKQKKFLFLKYTLPERTRKLSYRLNIGVINCSYRNGYAYSGQGAVINSPSLFDDYHFNFLSGFRMGSAVDYTISLKNKNRVQLSYLWDACKTGGSFETFQMAHHIFKISLLFNTNNQ